MPFRSRTHLHLRPLVPLILDAPPSPPPTPSLFVRAMSFISTACSKLGTTIGIMRGGRQPRYREQQRLEYDHRMMQELHSLDPGEPSIGSLLRPRRQHEIENNAGEADYRDESQLAEPRIYKQNRGRRGQLQIQVLNEIHLFASELPFRRVKRHQPQRLYSRFETKRAARPLKLLKQKKKQGELGQEKEQEMLTKGFDKVQEKIEMVEGEDEGALTSVHEDDAEQRPAAPVSVQQPARQRQEEENAGDDVEDDKQSEVKEDEKATVPEKPRLFQKQTEEEKQSSTESAKPIALFGSSFLGQRKQNEGASNFPHLFGKVEKKENVLGQAFKPLSTPEKRVSPFGMNNPFGKASAGTPQEKKEEKPAGGLFSGGSKIAFPSVKSGAGGLFSKVGTKVYKKEEGAEQKDEKKEIGKEPAESKPKSSFAAKSAGFGPFQGSFIKQTKDDDANFFEDDNQFADGESEGNDEKQTEQKQAEPSKPALFSAVGGSGFLFKKGAEKEDTKPQEAEKKAEPEKKSPFTGSLFGAQKGGIQTQGYTLFGKKQEEKGAQGGIRKPAGSLFSNSKGNFFSKQAEAGTGFGGMLEKNKGPLFGNKTAGSGKVGDPS